MTKAQAHANIALIKYWGKADEELALPSTSSLSLTLDALYTITEVNIDPALQADHLELNGQIAPLGEQQKISRFVDLFRKDNLAVRITSTNYFPTAAGLASSASGFAALATALNTEFGHNYDSKTLSRLTRRGSGSAARSLFGGFAIWQRGDDETSFAYGLEDEMDIEMVIAVVSDQKKERSSRSLMSQTVRESLYFDAWVKQNAPDLEAMQAAIKAKDIRQVGRIAERNAMMMHGTQLALYEPFLYFRPDTLRVLDLVSACRADGLVAYYTMDAGPNVKIITNSGNRDEIVSRLRSILSADQILVAKAGPAAKVIK